MALGLRGARCRGDNALAIADDGSGGQGVGLLLYARALVPAHEGEVSLALDLARRGLAIGTALDDTTGTVANRSVLGFLEIYRGDAAACLHWTASLPEQWEKVGYLEPGAAPFTPDRLEALIALGRHAEAARDLAGWEALGRTLNRPRVLATGARCRGLLAAARGEPAEALRALAEAVHHHDRLPSPHERARTLLVLGAVQRRAGRRTDARATLGDALSIFIDIEEPLWADRARSEYARIG